MADIFTKEFRSYIMSRVGSKNTKPEILLRKALHKEGYRFRIHNKNLPGTPDIVLKKYSTVIFVNGCFWHGHQKCKYGTIPKSSIEMWENKIMRNKRRDQKNKRLLSKDGWNVITVFECQLKNSVKFNTLTKIFNELKCQ